MMYLTTRGLLWRRPGTGGPELNRLLRPARQLADRRFRPGVVAAAIGIKQWCEATGPKGQVRVCGTPAEEGGGGKVYMVRAGLFKDGGVTLYWRPADANNASQDRNLANTSAKFRFH